MFNKKYCMKTVTKKLIYIGGLLLPLISNADQGFCGAGTIKQLYEGYQGTTITMIYLNNTEGRSSMKHRQLFPVPVSLGIRQPAIAHALRLALSTNLPVRIYAEFSPSNFNPCDYVNEVRICLDAVDCN